MRKNLRYQTRKIHRYLGLFIGVQFFFWTLGGLYFSWNNMDDVHGDLLRRETKMVTSIQFDSLQPVLQKLQQQMKPDSVASIELVNNGVEELMAVAMYHNGMKHVQLINLKNNQLKEPLNEEEAVEVAKAAFIEKVPVKQAVYITEKEVSAHSEYREKPLPAYAITFDHPQKPTVYVATQLGKVTSVRNNNWRRFDFLWMLHTMDYESRDHITNWLLRIFSVMGILTILSGFLLFGLTSPTVRRRFRRRIADKNSVC